METEVREYKCEECMDKQVCPVCGGDDDVADCNECQGTGECATCSSSDHQHGLVKE